MQTQVLLLDQVKGNIEDLPLFVCHNPARSFLNLLSLKVVLHQFRYVRVKARDSTLLTDLRQ